MLKSSSGAPDSHGIRRLGPAGLIFDHPCRSVSGRHLNPRCAPAAKLAPDTLRPNPTRDGASVRLMGRRRRPAADVRGDQACSMPSSYWVQPITIGPSVDCPRVGTRSVLGSFVMTVPQGVPSPLVLLLVPGADKVPRRVADRHAAHQPGSGPAPAEPPGVSRAARRAPHPRRARPRPLLPRWRCSSARSTGPHPRCHHGRMP